MRATNEAVLITEPPPARRSAGMPCLQPRKTPFALTSSVRSHTDSSVAIASSSFGCMMPALLKRTFSRPNSRSAATTIRSQSFALRSQARAVPISHRRVGGDRVVVLRVHDAGVVEEDVQPAELALGRDHHPLAVLRLGYVSLEMKSSAALLLHELNRLLRGLLVDIDGEDIRAFAREEQRRLASDAAACAGDQRHFVFESHMRSKYLLRRQRH